MTTSFASDSDVVTYSKSISHSVCSLANASHSVLSHAPCASSRSSEGPITVIVVLPESDLADSVPFLSSELPHPATIVATIEAQSNDANTFFFISFPLLFLIFPIIRFLLLRYIYINCRATYIELIIYGTLPQDF